MVSGPHDPAFTVASLATTTTGRPEIRPSPVTTPAAGAWPSYWSQATSRPTSNHSAPWSSSAATRSRAVSFPCSCWRRTLSGPPPCSSCCCSSRNCAVRLLSRVKGARPTRALPPVPGSGASGLPSAAEPQQAGEAVHDAARPVVVDDVQLHTVGEAILDGVVDTEVVVAAVRDQGAHLAALERLERGLDAVHGPAAAEALPHRLRVGALPGALTLLAQRQRRLPHLGSAHALGVQAHDAEHQVA